MAIIGISGKVGSGNLQLITILKSIRGKSKSSANFI